MSIFTPEVESKHLTFLNLSNPCGSQLIKNMIICVLLTPRNGAQNIKSLEDTLFYNLSVRTLMLRGTSDCTCSLTACSCFLFMSLMCQATLCMVSMASCTTSYVSVSFSMWLAISWTHAHINPRSQAPIYVCVPSYCRRCQGTCQQSSIWLNIWLLQWRLLY